MSDLRRVNRRSFLTRVIGAGFAGGGALVLIGHSAKAHPITDSDSTDAAGQGTSQFPASDTDQGATSDPAGQAGRLGHFSDSDSGANADPASHGRRWSDSDSGPGADPAGRGRRLRRPN